MSALVAIEWTGLLVVPERQTARQSAHPLSRLSIICAVLKCNGRYLVMF